MDLTSVDWTTVLPLTTWWPLLSTAKGLTGNMLYDVPTTDHPYTGAVVNMSTISAECGLLSNTSVGYWNDGLEIYCVNISGLGQVALPLSGMNAASDFFICLPFILGPNMATYIALNPQVQPVPGFETVSSSKPDYMNICLTFLGLFTV